MKNLFLMLCQQAENNQSYELAVYLTWRSHQRPVGYTATLWGDGEDLELQVWNKDESYTFDLSVAGKKIEDEEAAIVIQEETCRQEERLERFLEESHSVDECLYVLTTDYNDLWDEFGDHYRDAIDMARSIVDPAIEDSWDDYNPNFPNNNVSDGYIVNGQRYRLNYSGVAGHYWNSEWEVY